MSACLSDGKGGFRVAYDLRDFPITVLLCGLTHRLSIAQGQMYVPGA